MRIIVSIKNPGVNLRLLNSLNKTLTSPTKPNFMFSLDFLRKNKLNI